MNLAVIGADWARRYQPDLLGVTTRHSSGWLDEQLVNPEQVYPGSTMPVYDLETNARKALVAYLATAKPDEAQAKEVHDIDVGLVGWPWAENNFSWVEPTSWACLALRKAGQGDNPRVQEGVREKRVVALALIERVRGVRARQFPRIGARVPFGRRHIGDRAANGDFDFGETHRTGLLQCKT